jgi:glycerophosphoryl diester phosphodiesterase
VTGRRRVRSILRALSIALAVAASGAQALELQAHRGGRGLWPENTLSAFDQALALGVDTLELDIALTADDVVVVTHDVALNAVHTRDADGAWLAATGPRIRSLSLAQLQRHDVGRIRPGTAYAKQFAGQTPRDGERVPTLSAVFALVRARKADTASPEIMVRALLQEIDKAGMAQRVTVQSFDWRTLALVGELAPGMPRGYLTSARSTLRDSRWTAGLNAAAFASTPQLVKAAVGEGDGGATWSPSADDVTPEAVSQAQALGLRVVPWTVNRRAEMSALMDLGVDGLITDFPDVLRDAMRARGIRLPPAYAP